MKMSMISSTMLAWPLITLLIFFLLSSVENAKGSPRLGIRQRKTHFQSKNDDVFTFAAESDFKTYYYNQTLDHFNYRPESYATFSQKYVMNSKYWGGKSAPIFVWLGDEAPMGDIYDYIGLMTENAEKFKALLVYTEHRYYGESVPFGSRKEAYKNADNLGYFSSAQAIADYADILIHIKEELDAHSSPVIALGGSYGGMLATWFRLKYPHIVLGALASSAPILYFDDITPNDGYFAVASRDFQDESQSCYQTIKSSWDEIDRIASQSNGLSVLSQKLNTCSSVTDVLELKYILGEVYYGAAQYDASAVQAICQGIDGAPQGSDILTRIHAGLESAYGPSCLSVKINSSADETLEGWSWQSCTEMVMPLGCGNETMFFPMPFNLTDLSRGCEEAYGVQPRPHWVTSFYGGHDIKLVLQRFGSNIIFSNGLKDPYSSGGVLESLSESLVAISTEDGTHCMDLLNSSLWDSKSLVKQREEEVEIIQEWLKQYYEDLH